jgi:hypothetical protein
LRLYENSFSNLKIVSNSKKKERKVRRDAMFASNRCQVKCTNPIAQKYK